jgi:uncharacterized protein YqgC (DUF456 family)
MTVVDVVVAVLMAAGLVGAAMPLVPGTPLILAAAVIYAVATDFTPVGLGRLAILAVLALVSGALAAFGGVLGVRHVGGSRRAAAGALIGLVGGLFWPPLGLFVGPVVGAIVGELSRTQRVAESVRVGIGTLLGLLLGAVAHVVLAALMVAMFVWWVWRG